LVFVASLENERFESDSARIRFDAEKRRNVGNGLPRRGGGSIPFKDMERADTRRSEPTLQAAGIRFPKLPELDKEDVRAVRSFLPGKLLSRSAALLALSAVVFAFASLVDQGLKRILNVPLPSSPWLHYGLLFGLPLLAVASQLVVE
jgi:hypothetical protein